jgi:WD40 repeat protein
MNHNLLASGADDNLIKIWQWRKQLNIQSLTGHTSYIWSLCHQDGEVLSAFADRTIRLWDTEVGSCKHTFRGHDACVYVSEMHQGLIASGGFDSKVKIWDKTSGECIVTMSQHSSRVSALVCNGQGLVTGSYDRTIRFWDTRNWKQQIVLAIPRMVTSLSVLGHLVLSGGEDSTIQVWNRHIQKGYNQQPLCTYTEHVTNGLTPIRCTALGNSIFCSADASGLVIVRTRV